MLPLDPIGETMMPRSDEIFAPWKAQDIERGWSPFLTMHDTWAKSFSFIMSAPKVRGSSSGGSKWKKNVSAFHVDIFYLITIYFQIRWCRFLTSLVCCCTCKETIVLITNTWNDQHSSPTSYWDCRYAQVRWNFAAMKCPRKGHRSISLCCYTG